MEKGLLDAIKQGRRNGCTELVISGGEPTLLPDVIEKILVYSQGQGYQKYIIQTNGSGLSENRHLVAVLDEMAQEKEVCISFSIHGHNAKIHDQMCQTEGAFEKLMRAIENISSTKCRIYTNTVISRLNISNLDKIAKKILPFKPEIMQFAMMHLEESNQLQTGLIESALAVRQLKNIVASDILRTEGIPYCLMYGMEKCVGESYWPAALDLYNKNDDYMNNFDQLEYGMRWKSTNCKNCIMNEICAGIWKEHAAEFMRENIKIIG